MEKDVHVTSMPSFCPKSNFCLCFRNCRKKFISVPKYKFIFDVYKICKLFLTLAMLIMRRALLNEPCHEKICLRGFRPGAVKQQDDFGFR